MHYTVPDGFTVDPRRLALHRRALDLIAPAHGVDYVAAVKLAGELLTAPAEYTLDADRAHLHQAALHLQQRTGTDYLAAVQALEQLPQAATVRLRAGSDGRATLHLEATASVAGGAFTGLAYSGGVAALDGESFAIDLANIKLPPRVSLLLNHDAGKIAGSCAVANVAGALLRVEDGRFSAVTPAGREAAALHREGHPFTLSVGVSGRFESRLPSEDTHVNGRALRVASVLRAARLLEVSLVPAGAYPAARLDPRA